MSLICTLLKTCPSFLSAAWVRSNLFIHFSARDADLRSEQPSGHLTIFSIWFQAQLLSVWPTLFLANMRLSSRACRTSTAVNVIDKVSEGRKSGCHRRNLTHSTRWLQNLSSVSWRNEWMAVAAAGAQIKGSGEALESQSLNRCIASAFPRVPSRRIAVCSADLQLQGAKAHRTTLQSMQMACFPVVLQKY